MKVIYKYDIWILKIEIIIQMPKGAKILSVKVQNNKPRMWVLADPDKPMVQRQFLLLETGQKFAPYVDLNHVGTFQLRDGDFVGHLFEVMG